MNLTHSFPEDSAPSDTIRLRGSQGHDSLERARVSAVELTHGGACSMRVPGHAPGKDFYYLPELVEDVVGHFFLELPARLPRFAARWLPVDEELPAVGAPAVIEDLVDAPEPLKLAPAARGVFC